MLESTLQTAIQAALKTLGLSRRVKVEIEHPADESHGDWSSNVALKYHQEFAEFKGPRDLAEALMTELESFVQDNQDIAEVSIAGPGFLNFRVSNKYYHKMLDLVVSKNEVISKKGEGKKVIVEYSSPNIAKPFTVGHLRSTIIGDAIANIYEGLGWKVYRDNHLGDWGTQFGKLIYAIKNWADIDEIKKTERPVKTLVELYVRFHEEAEQDPSIIDQGRLWFKKLEDGNQEARDLWQTCIDLSWKEFDKIYRELGIDTARFENGGRGYGESYFEDKMDEVIVELEQKLPESEAEKNGGYYGGGKNGAKLVFFNNEKLPAMMILKGDGATLYQTRDLATDKFRLVHYDQPDLIINEVGAEQELYFKQLYEIERMLGWYQEGQRVHVKHGLYRFQEGKMSTRKGNVVWLEEVIEEAKKRAYSLSKHDVEFGETSVARKSLDETPTVKTGSIINNTSTIGIGALKWNDLKSETTRDIVFDWDEILSMRGNSAPYLQYAGVRAKSVLKKAKELKKSFSLQETFEYKSEELSLVRHIGRFNEHVQKAADEFSPHHLALYLYELAQRFNAFYNSSQILKAKENKTTEKRLILTKAFLRVLTEGLELLGIKIPEEM